MDLTIRIPRTDLRYYISRFFDLVEAGDLHIDLFLHARIHDNEDFIQECYSVNCHMLNYAAELGQYDIVVVLSTFPEIMKYLEKKDTNGKTPMEWAIYNNDSDMIVFFISKKAIIDCTALWNSLSRPSRM